MKFQILKKEFAHLLHHKITKFNKKGRVHKSKAQEKVKIVTNNHVDRQHHRDLEENHNYHIAATDNNQIDKVKQNNK